MQIKELENKKDIKNSFQIISQLYTDLSEEEYITNISVAFENGYKMAGVFKEENLIGIVGIRIIDDIRKGKIIKIDDFMICKSSRGIGVGKMLIKWVQWQELKYKCIAIFCHIGIERAESQKIFLREGFTVEGLYLKK